MVGLRRPRKRVAAEAEEHRAQPLVTPAQRILQRQWLQPARPQARPPPNVHLPQGTDISLVPAASTSSGTRKNLTATSVEKGDLATGGQGSSHFKVCTVVPPMLSPMSSNHTEDENEDHQVQIQIQQDDQGRARSKMADPTPTTADAIAEAESSTQEMPSRNEPDKQPPPRDVVTVAAQVQVPAEPRRERAGGSQPHPEAMGDNIVDEDALIFSQEEDLQMYNELKHWRRRRSEKLEKVNRDIAMTDHEIETVREKLQQLLLGREELVRNRDRLLAQDRRIADILNG